MNTIVNEILDDANAVLVKVLQAQIGLPPGVTDPILVKVEGAIEGAIEHLSKHPDATASHY